MEHREATINSVQGFGIAVVRGNEFRKECAGVFRTDNLVGAMLLADGFSGTYTGFVVDGARVEKVEADIVVSSCETTDSTAVIRFMVNGNPFTNIL